MDIGSTTVRYAHDNKLIYSSAYDYDLFGVQMGDTSTVENNPYRYCGEYYDTESGYTYLRARYYDPKNGRFVSEDSAMDGDNWYVYCSNDPVNRWDPSGHYWGSDYVIRDIKSLLIKSQVFFEK